MTLVKIYIWWNFVGMHALNKFVVQGEIVSKNISEWKSFPIRFVCIRIQRQVISVFFSNITYIPQLRQTLYFTHQLVSSNEIPRDIYSAEEKGYDICN